MKPAVEAFFQGNYLSFYEKYLPDIKRSGGQEYKACCPFHDEDNPSFNFNNENGTYYCHGCGKKGHAFHFYGKFNGLHTKKDFRKILKGIADEFGIPWREERPTIVKTYDYSDVGGNLLFQVVRMEPKTFRQRRPNGETWIWDLKGVQMVLYRLPDISQAQEVLIVEGEKDVDNLRSLGFTATTCPMGAKKWKDHYNESLREKDIILIPDNDNEGREHMAQVGAALNGIARSLKWLELPELPSKGDITDWISAFKDPEGVAERLSIMIDGAKSYQPPKKLTIDDVILDSQSFCKIDIPPRQAYLEPWLKEGSINLVSGWRGVGKTWFALSILDAVTKSETFGPWRSGNSVPCLLLDGEMAIQDTMDRIQSNSDRKNPLFIYSDAYANQLGLPRAHLAHENWRTTMKRILISKGIKLWVIDNLASLASGLDENLKRDWDPINAWLLELRFAGIATIMLHHVGKEGQQRGTSAREDNLDISITLRPPGDYVPEDGARFQVRFTKARVRTEDLPLVADTEFKLTTDELGQLIWTWGSVKRKTKNEVLTLLDEGMSQTDVAKTLGITKGTVSKIRSKALNDSCLTSKNKLTQSGFLEVNRGEN